MSATTFREAVPNRLYDGDTLHHATDHKRLRAQHGAVFKAMAGEAWLTLTELEKATGYPQASVSARLRDFRKEKFGGHTVLRRRRRNAGGTWEYCLLLNHERSADTGEVS